MTLDQFTIIALSLLLAGIAFWIGLEFRPEPKRPPLSDDPLTIDEMVFESFETSRQKGWHEEPRTVGDLIALMHSELSEALEEFRDGQPADKIWFRGVDGGPAKPEGVPVELADVVIRIGDFCGRYGIDLDEALRIKMYYNRTRPHRHGGKVL